LAFWRAKGYEKGKPKRDDDPHAQLLAHVTAQVQRELGLDASPDLLAWIVTRASTEEYRRATAVSIAFLTWLKRFAEAELEHEQTTT